MLPHVLEEECLGTSGCRPKAEHSVVAERNPLGTDLMSARPVRANKAQSGMGSSPAKVTRPATTAQYFYRAIKGERIQQEALRTAGAVD